MTIRSTPPISLTDVMTELRTANPGRAYPISLGDADVRALAGKPSGAISLSDLYGKSAYTPMSGSIPDVRMTAMANPPSSRTETAEVKAYYNGGTSPFNHVWSTVSGPGSVDSVNSPTSTARMPNPRFSMPETESTQVVQLVVTDSTGKQLILQGNVTLTLT